MTQISKGPSYLSSVLGLLRGKPQKIKAASARRSAARTSGKQAKTDSANAHPYRAAEIVSHAGACAAAAAVAHKRFLLAEVPRLPLPGCTARKCTCTYARYKDRRSRSMNRRADFSMLTRLYAAQGNAERRKVVARRAVDAEERSVETDFDFDDWD